MTAEALLVADVFVFDVGAAVAVTVVAAVVAAAAVTVAVVAEAGVRGGRDEVGRRGAACGSRGHMRHGT